MTFWVFFFFGGPGPGPLLEMQVLRSARRGVRSSDSARASWQRGVWRKPIAKHWPDEQKADSRLIQWVRGLKDSKPKYTYGAE